jgi:hypothetical protein
MIMILGATAGATRHVLFKLISGSHHEKGSLLKNPDQGNNA